MQVVQGAILITDPVDDRLATLFDPGGHCRKFVDLAACVPHSLDQIVMAAPISPEQFRGAQFVELLQRLTDPGQHIVLMMLLRESFEFGINCPQVTFEILENVFGRLNFLA
jgi:hypothetical protein